jgi:phage-related protein
MGKRRGRRASPASEPPRKDPPRKWHWFRTERDGRPLCLDELKELPTEARAGLSKCIQRYLARESRRQDVDALGDGIFELRHRHLNNHYRILFMHWGPDCVGLTAFYKNQQATPKSDIDRAKRRAARWREIFGDAPPSE